MGTSSLPLSPLLLLLLLLLLALAPTWLPPSLPGGGSASDEEGSKTSEPGGGGGGGAVAVTFGFTSRRLMLSRLFWLSAWRIGELAAVARAGDLATGDRVRAGEGDLAAGVRLMFGSRATLGLHGVGDSRMAASSASCEPVRGRSVGK